jgi:hypothetical protein
VKADEHIYSGMLVWDKHGRTARVTSLMVACGSVREDGTVDLESKTTVRLWASQGEFDTTLEEFLKSYHRRMTGWERLDRVLFEEPTYAGHLVGHYCISVRENEIHRVEHRARGSHQESIRQRDEILALAGYCGHSERYEKFSATSWKLVLDPVL